ncbi:MAG: hypothetical protein Q9186_000499 [Xanthomendoza sp. 1 TL-2023]
MTTPLIRSATKRQFLIQLGLEPNDERTSQMYWLLKDEAIRAYEAQLQGRRDLLRPEYANQDPPYAAAHFTAAAFSSVVRSIYASSTSVTRAYYNRGRTSQGDNWVDRVRRRRRRQSHPRTPLVPFTMLLEMSIADEGQWLL